MRTRLALLLLLALCSAACRDRDREARDARDAHERDEHVEGSGEPAGGWEVGEHVDVEWKGSWWHARIVANLPNNRYRVHYIGWHDTWDEAVGSERIRAKSVESRHGSEERFVDDAPPPPRFLAGDRVDVLWRGSWWHGTVLSGGATANSYRVHYLGFDARYDESVHASRIRRRH